MVMVLLSGRFTANLFSEISGNPLRLPGLVLATLLLITGCSSGPSLKEYVDEQPRLNLFEFFEGNVQAWGIVQNRKGDVVQRFRVNIDGTVVDNTLTLDETFVYLQGNGVTKRIWEISEKQTGIFEGQAGDIEGKASGSTHGNALNWRYEMDLTVDSGTYRVKFDDWMWLVDEDTLINRAYIKKFGLVMAEVTLFMHRGTDLPLSPDQQHSLP